MTVSEMIASPEVRAEVDAHVAHADGRFKHAEQVKKCTLLPGRARRRPEKRRSREPRFRSLRAPNGLLGASPR